MKTVFLVGAVAGGLMAAGLARAWVPGLGAEQVLAEGRPWSEVTASTEGAALIQAAIDIAAPPKTVWSVMNDCPGMNRIIVTLVSCKVLEGDNRRGWDVREQVTRGNFFVPTIHNVVHNDYQPYTLIRFHKVGGDLRIEEGEWRLESLSGGAATRVIYVNRVAVNILAPASMVREGTRRDTAKVLINLRRVCVAAARAGA